MTGDYESEYDVYSEGKFKTMTEFRLHVWSRGPSDRMPTATYDAQSNIHGAALALREFARLGYDISLPGAHVDVKETNGRTHTIMISEVLDWLHQPEQVDFVAAEHLAPLLEVVPPSQI